MHYFATVQKNPGNNPKFPAFDWCYMLYVSNPRHQISYQMTYGKTLDDIVDQVAELRRGLVAEKHELTVNWLDNIGLEFAGSAVAPSNPF